MAAYLLGTMIFLLETAGALTCRLDSPRFSTRFADHDSNGACQRAPRISGSGQGSRRRCRSDLPRHGLTRAALAEDDALILLYVQIPLLEFTAEMLNCPDFGLRLAATQDINILGPLAIAMQSAATVLDAALSASRYLFVHSTGVAVTIFERSPQQPDLAELRYDILLPRAPVARQWLEMSLGFSHQVIQQLALERYVLAEVHLPHRPLAPAQAFKRFFGAPIHTGKPHAALLFNRRALTAPMKSASRELQRMATNYIESCFPGLDPSLAKRVELAVGRSLGSGGAQRESVAQLLCMHPRTLQRRLSEEGTTFESILDMVRREAAWRYLTNTDLPAGRIAALVGLARQSGLTRACRRWFGMTPSEVRAEGAAATP